MAKKQKSKKKQQTSKSSKVRQSKTLSKAKGQKSKVIKYIFLAGLILALVYGAYSIFNTNQQPGDFTNTFSLLPSEYTGIYFENQVQDGPDRGMQFYDYFYNGGGIATGDINNDGLPDVFFTGNDVPNRLYVNKGNFQFEDISLKAGIQSNKWGAGATMVDINKDGFLDIYVCNSGPYINLEGTFNELYINNGNNTFTEKAGAYGIADASRSTQASFFDMDKDGDLDLWVMNHGLRNRGSTAPEWFRKAELLSESDFNRECNTLYRNDGNGKFTDISKSAGIQKIGFGLGLAIRDFDEDGYLDIYIANDFFIPDFLFMNNGDGTFTDKLKSKFGHIAYYAMGCDAADFNNDGLTDLVTVDMTPSDHVRNKVLMSSMDVKGFVYLTELKDYTPQYMLNSLSVNNGYGIMSDIALYAGVSQTDWSWAPLLADFDNDGLKDLMITNGFRKDTKNNDWQNSLIRLREEKGANYKPADYYEHLKKAEINPVANQIFKNKDGLHFDQVTDKWGFNAPSFSNGAAYADLDVDGDLDLVINNFDQDAFVYRNNSREKDKGHFIRFKLTDGKSANAVMHSKVFLHYGDEIQCNDFAFSRGYQSFVEPVVHFGLGQQTKVDRAVIHWNDGQQTVIENPKIDQVHLIDKKTAVKKKRGKEAVNSLFANITSRFLAPGSKHEENYFDDFAKEILLPHRQSMLGPALTVGDVNGDGLEDFYIGGAKGQAGVLYLQSSNGQLVGQSLEAFNADSKFEDVGAQFFDADNDNDLDLYIASGGGGDFEGEESLLQDRLYLNNGQGAFSLVKDRLPDMKTSTQAIAVSDWDNDGDLDMFVGGRTSPGKYPLPPQSYLLINNNGSFSDMTQELSPSLSKVGMVTGAEWSDVDKDGRQDLLLVGEWMPITVFKNKESGFEDATNEFGLSKTTGWWSSLHKVDFDNDGDEDFIAGNIGLNNKFHPSEEKPLYVYANDFDKNGSLDIVLSKIYKDQKVPVRGKECSSSQMPFISEKFPTYNAFANANLESIYQESELENSTKYEAYNFASLFIENNGKGGFEIKQLPAEAQLAPINGIVSNDFDKDGKIDVVIGGSVIETEVETPRYDAGKGLYLKGIGSGDFKTNLQIEYSGLFLQGDVKDIKLIHLGEIKKQALLVANNNDILELFVFK